MSLAMPTVSAKSLSLSPKKSMMSPGPGRSGRSGRSGRPKSLSTSRSCPSKAFTVVPSAVVGERSRSKLSVVNEPLSTSDRL